LLSSRKSRAPAKAAKTPRCRFSDVTDRDRWHRDTASMPLPGAMRTLDGENGAVTT
jgi:hypothetical protein